MSDIPKGAEVYDNGLYYKIGVHNKPFFFNGEDWVRSDKTYEFVSRRIRNRVELERTKGVSRFSSEGIRDI